MRVTFSAFFWASVEATGEQWYPSPWTNFASQCGVTASLLVDPGVCSYTAVRRGGGNVPTTVFCCWTRSGSFTNGHPLPNFNGQQCCNVQAEGLCQHGACPVG